MNNEAPQERYYLLRIAHEQYGCAPEQLSAAQRGAAARIAARQRQIEAAVLYSPQALGVVIPEAQLDDAWARLVSRYADADALHAALAAQGLDAAGMRERLGRELKVEAVLERVCADLPALSDTDVSLYYFSHPEQFEQPAARVARHILITVNPDFPENRREAARSRIELIARRLQASPERFAEQALKHSECPTALQDGLLGTVRPGTLYPELEACLFGLAVGQIGPVVESPLGFHLLRCEAIQEARRLTLDEVLPRLRDSLQNRQRKARQRQWLAGLLQPSVSGETLHG